MALDNDKVERLYVAGNQVRGRDRFDLREGVTSTLYEAAMRLTQMEFPSGRLTEKTNLVLPVWFGQNPIYLEWRLHSDRRIMGIENYDENAKSLAVSGEVREFLYGNLLRNEVLGVMPMDREATELIAREENEGKYFVRECLARGIAVLNHQF